MTGRALRALFAEFADRLEIQGGLDARKAAAYRRAAIALRDWPQPVEAAAAEGKLLDIPGIGPVLARKIEEFLTSGRIEALDLLRAAMPPEILSLTAVPGVGARTAGLLWREAGVTSLAELEAAALAGRLRDLPGVGAAKERRMLEGAERLRAGGGRFLLAEARPLADALARALGGAVAGEVRRACPLVSEVVVVAPPGDVGAGLVPDLFVSAPEDAAGGWAAVLANGLPVRCVFAAADAWGVALLRETGGPEHLAALGPLPARAADEEEAYAALGLPWIAPELREGTGEVAAAREGALPRLLELADVRGDLHSHTRWSDGGDDLAAMAAAARERGYEYLAVTDHSRSLHVAHGLDAARLRAQRAEVDGLNAGYAREGAAFRVLQGCEVEVLGDGALDLDDETLAGLDFVIASMHSPRGQDGPALTARVLRAVEHPRVHLIGHPSGRRLGRREPYPVDLGRVAAAAAARGVWLEVNGSAERLDLDGAEARRARVAGCGFCADTDAHSAGGLAAMELAVATARRGWLGPEDVWNTRPLGELLAALRRRGGGGGA